MKSARGGKELLRRYVTFIIALFIIALGTSMSIRANLGSSPISCPPYVLSLVPGNTWTMGEYVICMHIIFILSQILLLRKNYQLIQLLQIAVSFLFGFISYIFLCSSSVSWVASFTARNWLFPFRFLWVVSWLAIVKNYNLLKCCDVSQR